MRRACADGLLQYSYNVSPGFGVPFRYPAPVPPRCGQRGSALAAQHGHEPGRRVPTGAARYERKPQCGECSHVHLSVYRLYCFTAWICLWWTTSLNHIWILYQHRPSRAISWSPLYMQPRRLRLWIKSHQISFSGCRYKDTQLQQNPRISSKCFKGLGSPKNFVVSF